MSTKRLDDLDDWLSNAAAGVSRRQFLAGVSATGASLVGFAVAANPVAGQVVTTPAAGLIVADATVPSAGFPLPIYEARPAAAGRYPVVLVIPEVWGMHEHIKDVARRFAREGFLAVTFETYAREGGTLQLPDQQAVMKVANSVSDAQALGDLDALVTYVQTHPSARPDRIGVTGFCRGGMYALLFAAHNPAVKAAVPWYGPIKPAKTPGIREVGPLDVAAKITAPVLGLYGEADQGIPAADVKEMEAALKSAGATAEFILYKDAPHAFNADYRQSYRPEAAKDAWGRCIAWFTRYLKA
jgi:carboxymethylenebutenolidase